jgi:putative ABC transport system permease protein
LIFHAARKETLTLSYALATIWHERQRFLPGVLAVAFSALLISVQVGLLLGLFTVVSLPIDRSKADVWIGYPGIQSLDLGQPIPETWQSRLAMQPEVERTEPFMTGFVFWNKRVGGPEMCLVIGSRLETDAIGAVAELTPEMRVRLTEPGTIVLDETALSNLGLHGVGDEAQVGGHRVRLVGVIRGYKGLAGSFIFCSLPTARMLLRQSNEQATYLLARCHRPEQAAAVVQRLRTYRNMTAFTRDEFSLRSRMHWLTMTNAGIALGSAALLGLIIGAAVTSQTLYGATAAALRQYAALEALGIPTWRMVAMVLSQSFWVGLAGITLALPTVFLLAQVGELFGARVLLSSWLLAATGAVTMAMALASGVIALRSLRLVEPANLLR